MPVSSVNNKPIGIEENNIQLYVFVSSILTPEINERRCVKMYNEV